MNVAEELKGCQVVVIAVDVSGSTHGSGVHDKWLAQIHQGTRDTSADLHLVTFDYRMQRHWRVDRETIRDILQINSAGGGSDILPVIEFFENNGPKPDKYLVFTDGLLAQAIPPNVALVVQIDNGLELGD